MSASEQSITIAGPARRQARDWRPLFPRIVTAGVIGATLLVWHFASTGGWVNPAFLPAPGLVASTFWSLIASGYVDSNLFEHAATSLGRVLGALFFAILVGVPVGLIIATSPIGRAVLDPVVEFLRPLPPLAYLPLVIIWFGIGEPSKVLIIALAMLAPIAISTAAGVGTASKNQINAARAFGATRLQLLRHVLLPSALPSVLTGIRIALGAGWTTLVAAELVAAARGLGYMIQAAGQFLVTDVVIAGIFVIAALSFGFEALLRLVERLFFPWSRHR